MPDETDRVELSERTREFFTTISEGCVQRIERATVAVLGIQHDRIEHNRTGVLYGVGGEHFILTASHYLIDFANAGVPLYMSMNESGVTPIPLYDAKYHSSDDDKFDVAVIWLPPELAKEVAQQKEFLPHSQINYAAASKRGPFLFFGYPEKWSGHVVAEDFVASRGLAFTAFPHYGDLEPSAPYDPDVHMVLNFTREAINTENGSIDRLPHLRGISGCGIWQVGDVRSGVIIPRTEDNVTLVGIQHRWMPDFDYIQGTQICHPLEYIRKTYSKAAGAMMLAYPARN